MSGDTLRSSFFFVDWNIAGSFAVGRRGPYRVAWRVAEPYSN